MTWVKLSDTLHDDPDIDALPLDAVGVFTLILSWCGRHETDGVVPRHRAALLSRGKKRAVAELVERRLLVDDGVDDLRVRSWLKYQPSKAELDQRRERWAAKKRQQRLVDD